MGILVARWSPFSMTYWRWPHIRYLATTKMASTLWVVTSLLFDPLFEHLGISWRCNRLSLFYFSFVVFLYISYHESLYNLSFLRVHMFLLRFLSAPFLEFLPPHPGYISKKYNTNTCERRSFWETSVIAPAHHIFFKIF